MAEKRQSVKNTEDFEIEYRTILEELKQKPVDDAKQGENSERWRWFQQMDDYDAFVTDMMSCISPAAQRRYEELSGDVCNKTLDFDSGIASSKRRKDVDSEVFMITLRECVNRFTGVNLQGKEYQFTQSVINRYKQLASVAAAKNDLAQAGITIDISDKILPILLKLSKEIRKTTELCGSGQDRDAVIDECIKKSKYTVTKEMKQYLKTLLDMNVVSMEAPVGEEDDINIGDIIPDYHDPYESIHETNATLSFLCRLMDHWENIAAATFKKDRNLLKAFLSRQILILLKLRWLSPDYLEELKKDKSRDYIKELEPQCRKWCPKRTGCSYPESHKCYVRWGRLNDIEPAGDEEVYEQLSQCGEAIYQKILKNDYVCYAFDENPEDLYDLCVNELRDFDRGENSFEFTDAVIAKALGMRKDTVSRGKVKYESRVLPLMEKLR